MTWKATLNFLGASSIIFIAFVVVTNPTFENFTSLVILALGCFLFANIGIIKRGKATVDGGLEIETHEPVINPNAVEPPDDEKANQIEKVEGALEKESKPQPYEPSDDPFYDALRASIVYKDLALTEEALTRLARKEEWDEDYATSYKLKFLADESLLDGIGSLKSLEDKRTDWIWPSLYLSDHYVSKSIYDHALKHIEIAQGRAKSGSQKLSVNLKKVEVLLASAQKDNVLPILQSSALYAMSLIERRKLFEAFADYYHAIDDYEGEVYYLEAALKVDPEANHLRFRLAHLSKEKLLSFYHYSILTKASPTYPYGFNNLGATYDEFNLKGAKIESWEEAASKKEYHAVGNIAIALANQGFFSYAQRMLDEVDIAAQKEDRIVEARSFLKKKREEESKKLEELRVKAADFHRFYDTQAEKVIEETIRFIPDAIVGCWKGMNGILDISQSNPVRGEFKTEQKRYSVTARLIGGMILMNFKETHFRPEPKASGLARALSGGHLFSRSYSVDEQGWANSQERSSLSLLSIVEEFELRLQLKDKDTMMGLRVKVDAEFDQVNFERSGGI